MKEENSVGDKTSCDLQVTSVQKDPKEAEEKSGENKMPPISPPQSADDKAKELFWQYKQVVNEGPNRDVEERTEADDVKNIRLFDVVEIPDDDVGLSPQHQPQHQQQQQSHLQSTDQLPAQPHHQSTEQLPPQSSQQQQQSKMFPRKRGRPSTSDLVRNWSDKETLILIDEWKEHEILYNSKKRHCYNRNDRIRALESVERVLSTHGIFVNEKQIMKKLYDLKRYYGSQKKLHDESKLNAAVNGSQDIYYSSWKFHEKLDFLKDAFAPRNGSGPKNTIDYEDDLCSDSMFESASPLVASSESVSTPFNSLDSLQLNISSNNITPQNVLSQNFGFINGQNLTSQTITSQHFTTQNNQKSNMTSQTEMSQNIVSQSMSPRINSMHNASQNISQNMSQNITSQNTSQNSSSQNTSHNISQNTSQNNSSQYDRSIEPINKLQKGTRASPVDILSKQRQFEEDEDDAFCHLLKQQLKQIPDCEMKDDLKISLQQMVLKCKRHLKQTHS